MMLALMRMPTYSNSAEYADNRISLFSAQWGKCEMCIRDRREAMERSLTRDEERIEVLDKMVMRLYEDMIAGRISEQNFT